MRSICVGQLCLYETNIMSTKEVGKSYNSMLKERLEEYGVNSLMDAELLSLLTGIDIDTVKKALNDFGMPEIAKYAASMNLTKAQRQKLEMLNHYYKKMSVAKFKDKPVLSTSSKAGEYAISLLTGKPYECIYAICLDAQSRVNYPALINEGTINEAPVYTRRIIEKAINFQAVNIILVHNHPGGSLCPSVADMEATNRVAEATKAVGIKTSDHIIVAEGKYFSFAERGMLNN